MQTGSPWESLAPDDVRVVQFDAGRFDTVKRGWVHVKTCAHVIFAQAIQGRYEIECGDGRHADLAEGEAFLTPANLPLRITHHGDRRDGYRMRARWLHARYAMRRLPDATALLDLPLRVSGADSGPLAAIAEELLNRDDSESLAALAHRQELACRALRHLCALAPLKSEAVELLRHKSRIGPVLLRMESRMEERLTVAQLARETGLSPARFHALFLRLAGCSPMKYRKRRRLATVCRLLAQNDESLATIAEQTGFCNEFHLSREFRKAFGVPPGQWRREHDPTLA